MDEMFSVMPDQTKAILMREAIAQAEATVDMMKQAADSFRSNDLDGVPEQARELASEFFTNFEEADPKILTSLYIHGFFAGVSHLFRTMSVLDAMSEFLNSDCQHMADIEFVEDDDDTDRAGLPKQKPGLSSMGDDEIHQLINNMTLWRGLK